MTEGEVNVKVRQWLLDGGYKYRGVLTGKGKVFIDNDSGVLIDHQGEKDYPIETLWIESQGSCIGIDKLLNGFIAVLFASTHGDLPSGILAIPDEEYNKLMAHIDFLETIVKNISRPIGLFNINTMFIRWLNVTP